MLFLNLALVLAGGFVPHGIASPISQDASPRKRHVPASHALHERHLPHRSRHWTKRDKVPNDAILPMRIGLKQSNLEEGHLMLLDM